MDLVGRNNLGMPCRTAAGLVLVSAILFGCAATYPATQSSPRPGSSAVGSTALATSRAAPTTLTLTKADNGKTVRTRTGDHLTIVLDSTYWTVQKLSGPVLQEDGPPIVDPKIGHCVPGGGCGTVTTHFSVVTTGIATITANRTTCGEAMRCSEDQGTYRVVVDVE